MQYKPEYFVHFIKILSVIRDDDFSYSHYLYIFMAILTVFGLAVFIKWAIENKFGKESLKRARYRSNSMPFYLPFAVIFGWFAISLAVGLFAKGYSASMPDWQQKFTTFLVLIIVEIIVVIFIIAAAKKYFDNGLQGFGFRKEGLGEDIANAAATFVAVWPLVFGALYLTILIGKIIKGPSFQFEPNEGMTVILQNNQLPLRILMIFFATILTPVFEELIFRGLLQSYLRDIGFDPWRSILAASVVFTMLHPLTHFLGIVILAVAMGYVYEKSGSLWRSIFLHCFFNSTQIAFALLS